MMGTGTNGPARVGQIDPFVVFGIFLAHYVAFPISPSFFLPPLSYYTHVRVGKLGAGLLRTEIISCGKVPAASHCSCSTGWFENRPGQHGTKEGSHC